MKLPATKSAAALAAVLALLLAACAPGEERSAADGAATTTYSDMADSCDPAMERALQAWVDEGYAGAIAVFGDDRNCAIGLGQADRATGRSNTADTSFSIGSVTKAVTAAAILNLADEGVIDLEDRASDHVSGLHSGAEELRIKNLLLHTSGLTGYHGRDHVAISKAKAIDAISRLEIRFDQGTRFSYTNAGYTLLALVVEEVSEAGYRDYVRRNILVDGQGQQIGGFWDGEPAAPEPRAVGYLAGNEAGELGRFAGPHWALDGNGGVAMTTLEMAEWTRALFSGEILSADATEVLLGTRKRQPTGESELPGWVALPNEIFGERVIASSGGGGAIGHLMDVAWLPDTQRVIAVAQNQDGYNANDLLANIADALVTGTGVPTPAVLPEAPTEMVEQLVGRYRLPAVADSDGDSDGEVADQAADSFIEIAVDDLDDRGLRVTATGSAAVAALFPVAEGYEGELQRHETNALAFARGETPESVKLFETELGPISGVRLVGTIHDGELVSYLELEHLMNGQPVWTSLAVALDDQGGSRGVQLDPERPSGWFVFQPDGEFGLHRRSETTAPVTLLPVPGSSGGTDLQLVGPSGLLTATRVR